jgi:hypothetical protein
MIFHINVHSHLYDKILNTQYFPICHYILQDEFNEWLIDNEINYHIWVPIRRNSIRIYQIGTDQIEPQPPKLTNYWAHNGVMIEMSDEDHMTFMLEWHD